MQIVEIEREVKGVIREHHIYGAECLINELVRAAQEEPYLTKEAMFRMIESAFKRESTATAEEVTM